MEYRKLPHGSEQISVIGLGGGSLPEDVDKVAEILDGRNRPVLLILRNNSAGE